MLKATLGITRHDNEDIFFFEFLWNLQFKQLETGHSKSLTSNILVKNASYWTTKEIFGKFRIQGVQNYF